MNKFNVGDKVVRVGSDFLSAKVGNTYTVEGFSKDCSIYLEEIFGEFDPEYFELVDKYNPDEAIPPEVVATGDELVSTQTEWTDKHYDNNYTLTKQDIERGFVKVDPYFVSKIWKIGSKDDSGALWHCFKTIARFGEKNSKEREIRALHAQIKRLAELEKIEL